MTFADPKSDIAFKKVFGNEQRTEILICFLNAVLDLHGPQAIAAITILNPYQAPKISLLKETSLDVRATTQSGVNFIVEMQVEKQDYFAKRALYYAAKAYVGQIGKAEEYPKLNQVVFIGILNFQLFDAEAAPHYLSRHLLLDQKTLKQEIKDLELNFIELPKFRKQEHELETIVEKWIYFFKHADDLTVIPDALSEPQELREAFEVLAQHTWTRDELDLYEYWQMEATGRRDALETAQRIGLEQGLEQGLEKGREEGILQVAQEMLRKGMPAAVVQDCTNLPETTIQRLWQELMEADQA
jgi:predicted transposase/invertase (TIGR01784 family)